MLDALDMVQACWIAGLPFRVAPSISHMDGPTLILQIPTSVPCFPYSCVHCKCSFSRRDSTVFARYHYVLLYGLEEELVLRVLSFDALETIMLTHHFL